MTELKKKDLVPLAPLTPARMKEAENMRHVWRIVAPAGVTREDLLKSEFWTHVAKKLRPTDKIEVRADDDSYYAELIVVSAGRSWAKVVGLAFVQMDNVREQELDLDDFEIRYRGAHEKWSVIRKKGKVVLSSNHADRTTALKWLDEHKKAL